MKKSMVNAAFWCYFNMLTQLVYISCLKTLEDEVYGEDPVFEFTGLFPFRLSNFLFHLCQKFKMAFTNKNFSETFSCEDDKWDSFKPSTKLT
jgi:hypothetical protein